MSHSRFRRLQRIFSLWLALALLLAPGRALGQDETPGTPIALTPTPVAPSENAAVNDDLAQEVEKLLGTMTAADRVGQLFIINFEGSDLSSTSDIALLIDGYRVGGVVISPQKLNFSNEKGVDTPRQVAALTNQLQSLAYGLVVPPERALEPIQIAPWPPEGYATMEEISRQKPGNIPLLIGVEQAGDGLPDTALRRGFTPLPAQMAIGATWNTALAQRVGEVVGRELHAVGVNLLLGPSLDVFDQPNVATTDGMGGRTFGGNAQWVSELGRAYISGVHNGGANQVATVARHFPGEGSSDRPPEEEVATIQKSLDEMRRTTLPPFVAATQGPSSIAATDGDPGSTDVIMTSHMRYSAFQGGAAGRVTPISLAPELSTLFSQEGFDEWRSNGVVMSNSLGVLAIRRFYGTSAQNYFSRRVALDAFMAGNDLLYLADFSLESSWESEMANIMQTIGFFQDRYNEDDDFAARVDAAVRRILRLKLGLYRQQLLPATAANAAGIPLPAILAGDDGLGILSGDPRSAAEGVMNEVARQGITILYPDPLMQTEPLPPTFRADDRILVFSDSRLLRDCSTCTAEAAIGPDQLADIIKSNYGANGTGQIDPDLITSRTFAELTVFLDNRSQAQASESSAAAGLTASAGVSSSLPVTTVTAAETFPTPTPSASATTVITQSVTAPDLEAAPVLSSDALAQERLARTESLIRESDWILFAMLDVDVQQHSASGAVTRFLSEYGDELAEQRLVVFALNAPYFLDATEMSRLTTYFGVYGKTQPFLENAVRALFRAFSLVGAPPVTVPGTRFASLAERLAPDPARTLPLQVTSSDARVLAANAEAMSLPAAEASREVTGSLTAGESTTAAALDVGSSVRLEVGPIIDRNGHVVPDGTLVEFNLRYEGEELSMGLEQAVTLNGVATGDVVMDRAGVLRVAAGSGEATSGEPLLLVVAPLPTPTGASIEGASADNAAQATTPVLPERVNLATLVIALFTIAITLSLFLIVQVRVLPRAILVHNMLWAAIFGLLGYLLYGIGLFPGANWLRANVSVWGTTVVVFIPMLLPLLWLQLRGEE